MRSGAAALFVGLRAVINGEASRDIEPEPRLSSAWTAWLYRDLYRTRRLSELAEAEALTTDPADPAPIASLGLSEFLEWVGRQQRRWNARRAA